MVSGILFDKDGTLFDFQISWSGWAAEFIAEISEGDAGLAAELAARIGFDPERRRFRPDSFVIAGTNTEIAAALGPLLPHLSAKRLLARLAEAAALAPMAEAVPLRPLLDLFRAAELKLGVATNDAEAPARAHLDRAGVLDSFDFVAGFDSGFGAKPGPGMCLAFADALGLAADKVVMVGDSLHDLHAGRAAGMRTVAVLTGVAGADTLVPHAEAVLPDIGALPGWLAGQGGSNSPHPRQKATQSVAIR